MNALSEHFTPNVHGQPSNRVPTLLLKKAGTFQDPVKKLSGAIRSLQMFKYYEKNGIY